MLTRRRAPDGLTEEDRALWRGFAARVTPLPGRLPIAAPQAAAQPAAVPQPPAAIAPPIAPKRVAAPPQHAPPLSLDVPPPGLDARRWRDLRRGRTRPERTLDLHGRRAEDAHAAVRAFLHGACAEGARCVAIVTGKGTAKAGGGVLRRELPHWLNTPDLRPLILGLAHPHAANAGAVHLLLRRRRPPTAQHAGHATDAPRGPRRTAGPSGSGRR